jgi:hypothetical protein
MKLEFHHINFVSEDVDRLNDFYTQVLGLDDIPIQSFPRPYAAIFQVISSNACFGVLYPMPEWLRWRW